MFSLLMVSTSGYWHRGGANFDLSRYLEYTDETIAQQLQPITEDA